MPKPKSAMEIFKLLDKSNCRECGEKTCLAFAGAVYQNRKPISACPRLDPDIVKQYASESEGAEDSADLVEQFLNNLRQKLSDVDLSAAAARSGGRYDGSKLTLKILGKDFGVDASGNFVTDIHVNPWIAGPFIDYIIHGKGIDPAGEWISYRETQDARAQSYAFFQKRCELAMKRIADTYTDLFDDLVHIFGGQKVAEQFKSDVSVVLHPLPKVPVMICYWAPEDGLESTLNLFFDKTVNHNLSQGSLFTIATGLAAMFEKLSIRHAAFTN